MNRIYTSKLEKNQKKKERTLELIDRFLETNER